MTDKFMGIQAKKVNKWFPVILYGANILTWLIIGSVAHQWLLLLLSLMPVAMILLYMVKGILKKS